MFDIHDASIILGEPVLAYARAAGFGERAEGLPGHHVCALVFRGDADDEGCARWLITMLANAANN